MGTSAGSVVKKLKNQGFEQVVRLAGGMAEWTAASLPVKKESCLDKGADVYHRFLSILCNYKATL